MTENPLTDLSFLRILSQNDNPLTSNALSDWLSACVPPFSSFLNDSPNALGVGMPSAPSPLGRGMVPAPSPLKRGLVPPPSILGGLLAPQAAPLPGRLYLKVWDVAHGACAMLHHFDNNRAGRLAMIDSGDTPGWTPSAYIRDHLNRTILDYLFITNADQDHISDLNGLWEAGLHIGVWHRNPTLGPDAFRRIKEKTGALTLDALRYMRSISVPGTTPVVEPFDQHMGGIKASTYWNAYPTFDDTNNLSLVVFITFGGFKILFPGDLEAAGWRGLLLNPNFRRELSETTILVASHHGRENGYCEEVFHHCRPRAVIMSDKAIVHETQQMAQVYHNEVVKAFPEGVIVATTGKRRHVLTTRRDGYVFFDVAANGDFTITTEFGR